MPPQQPLYTPPPAGPVPQSPYDFIVNPQKLPKKSPFGGGSLLMRIVVFGGGLVVLLFGFVFVKGLLTTDSSNRPQLISVAQDQQSIIHIVTATNNRTNLSGSTTNYVLTTELSINGAQNDLLAYMKKQKIDVDKKQLALKISPTTDSQLSAAATAGTYDATLRQTLLSQITTYERDLKQAYSKTTGPNGKKLLTKQSDGAKLLRQQLSAVATTTP